MSALLAVHGITKRFGTVAALVDVDLEVAAGEVHAVLGENGAGKSTLMRVIYGLVPPDAGQVLLRGQPARITSPRAARRAGIAMVHQEFALVDALSVLDNLALSLRPGARWWLRRAEVRHIAERVAGELGLELGDLDAPVGTLPVGRRQVIEIVKALAGQETALLILDEPTAVLTPGEVTQLFTVLDRLRRAGTAILFITHKLAEVTRLADRITVMRRGRVVAHGAAGIGEADLAQLMVGTLESAVEAPAPPVTAAPPVLELRGVEVDDPRQGGPALRDVDLSVHAGEVVGIAGVDGNGQDALFALLAGLRPPRRGTVRIGGAPPQRFAPAAMAASGIACIPPDRMREGVVAPMSVRENALLNSVLLRRVSPRLLTDRRAERRFAEGLVAAHDIRTADVDMPVGVLSGGNVQKLIVARALALAPRVLVAANPTRGLDVAAAQAVHAAITAALARGMGVLLISTDLDELIAQAHRIAVLYRGRLSRPLTRPFSAGEIGGLMAGSAAA